MQKYYLKTDSEPKWMEVTKEQYIDAEHNAGFHSKFGEDHTATSSFSGNGISGETRDTEKQGQTKTQEKKCPECQGKYIEDYTCKTCGVEYGTGKPPELQQVQSTVKDYCFACKNYLDGHSDISCGIHMTDDGSFKDPPPQSTDKIKLTSASGTPVAMNIDDIKIETGIMPSPTSKPTIHICIKCHSKNCKIKKDGTDWIWTCGDCGAGEQDDDYYIQEKQTIVSNLITKEDFEEINKHVKEESLKKELKEQLNQRLKDIDEFGVYPPTEKEILKKEVNWVLRLIEELSDKESTIEAEEEKGECCLADETEPCDFEGDCEKCPRHPGGIQGQPTAEEFSRKFGTCHGCHKLDVRVRRAEPLGDFCEDCYWDLEQQTPIGSDEEKED